MGIQAVIWDLGGVLVRTEDHTPRRRLAERLHIPISELVGLVFDSESSRRAQLGEIGIESHWDYVRQRLGLETDEMGEFRRQFWEGDIIDYDLVEDIQALRSSSYKTGLLSNAFSNIRDFIVFESKIADAFDAMVISAEEGIMKPEARIYEIALERLDVSPRSSVFIDDSPVNIEGANQVGMHAIQFTNPEQVRKDLRKLLDGDAS